MAYSSAQAQAWPERPVTVVVPYAAGGNTDTMARMAAEWLSNRLGQRFIVDNRAGAGGTLAAGFVAQSKPDGYTLLFAAAPQLLSAPLVQKVSYDAKKDFAPIGIFGTGPHILGIDVSVPANNIQEFIAYTKANPGKLSYASGGHGTSGHLHAALFAARAGLNMVHVPYKGGSYSTTDLLAGHVQMYFGNASELLPQRNSGKVKLLLTGSTGGRMTQLPDLPTLEELYPGFKLGSWNGFFAPAGTPQPILELLAKEVTVAVKDEKVSQRLLELGIEPGGMTLDKFRDEIEGSRGAYEDALKAADIKPMIAVAGQSRYGGLSRPLGELVKISQPALVTPMVCSNWADSERSRVTAVQPSDSTFTCGRPRLIIGSTVKNMPGRSTMPSPGRPTWTMFGSSWNSLPRPWPQKSRTTLMCCASTKVWIAWPMSPVVPPGRIAAMPRIIAS